MLDSTVYESNLTSVKAQESTLQQELIQLQQELQQDDTEHIRLLVNKIVARKLTFEEYQELISLTIKQIEVQEDKITVQTHFGNFSLPRKRISGQMRLPEYKWLNTGEQFKIYYHFNTFNIYKKQTKLFQTKNFTIYQQEENKQ